MEDFRILWNQGLDFDQFLAGASEQKALWEGVYQHATIPNWAMPLVAHGAIRKLLVLAEDWCGDAANTVPIMAALARQAESVELRIIKRDEHPEVMDQYLTNGSRSIPIVIALDENFNELGHWGPRPSELQERVISNQRAGTPVPYADIRRWYAKDKGETTLREVLALSAPAKTPIPFPSRK